MAKRRLFIPTFIRDEEYKPAQVSPRMFYYNGLLDSETWYIEGYIDGTDTIKTEQYSAIPYIDHYSTGSEITPDISSKSLLFFNETNPYGSQPAQNLYSQYWENYVRFLYNPRTRLVKVSAVIPLGEYFETRLNDLITFRGNLYQLRAINDYNIKDGTCKLELLGPVDRNIFDTTANEAPIPATTTLAPTTSTTSTTTLSTTTTTTTTTSTTTTSTTTSAPLSIEYLVIGGGGGGGARHAGGGGAGGYISGSAALLSGTSWTAVIGAGGNGNNEGCGLQDVGRGQSGNVSSLDTISALGGGYGGGGDGENEGGSGGSGGGGEAAGIGGLGFPSQGFNGGDGDILSARYMGGGGGGASQDGQDATSSPSFAGGDGGDGKLWLDGNTYAGGGAGGVLGGATPGSGGAGGGGNGGNSSTSCPSATGQAGAVNTGGGGGGSGGFDTTSGNGGNGGSGIVIIRYLGTQVATGGTITSSGGYTYHTFTSSGTFTYS